jgi:hypothetical protein
MISNFEKIISYFKFDDILTINSQDFSDEIIYKY